MSKKKKQLEELFTHYESNFNKGMSGQGNVSEEITNSFAACFVESSADGIICGKRGDQFVDKIKQGFEFYKSIGAKSMSIVSKDISNIDELHSLVKIHWRYDYEKDSLSGSIDFNTFYVVTLAKGEPQIFAYMSGDEQAVLKEKGLIAADVAVEH